jgi:hypothetical protein
LPILLPITGGSLTVVTLSDQQQDAIFNAARPLQPSERLAFMAALAELLVGCKRSLGDGELARTLRDLQRQHFRPPADAIDYVGSRHKFTGRV